MNHSALDNSGISIAVAVVPFAIQAKGLVSVKSGSVESTQLTGTYQRLFEDSVESDKYRCC